MQLSTVYCYTNLPSTLGVSFQFIFKDRSVSEFMSQKLDLITLHGMVKEGGGNGGSP